MGFLDEAAESVIEFVGDQVSEALNTLIGKMLYYLTSAILYILKLVYDFFAVFAGIKKVTYDGSESYLINLFFGNKTINNVYWGMALIGILLVIVFTFIAVLRKSFDVSDNHPKPMSSIMFGAGKSVLAILLLSFVMTSTLNLTNILVDRVNYVFDNADSFGKEREMTFTNEQYATMARIYNTIGNYSLNASSNSRFNLNSCYNAIRADLLSLQEDGVFDFYYPDEDVNGNSLPTWQSELQKLAAAHDPRYEIKIDDKNTITAIQDIMKILKTNEAFYPVSEIKRTVQETAETVSLDRIIFLVGTLDAAKDSYFNINPSITDAVREPFYYGDKSIYSLTDVEGTFDIMASGISYLMIILVCYVTIKDLALCIFNCIARIFNIISLYIVAPPIFSTMSLDEGAKFKQWVSATVVQMFSIFGCIIPMRLTIMFIPMILSTKLQLFDSIIMDLGGRVLLIVGAIEASNRFGEVITGLLTGRATDASAHAGNMKAFGAQTLMSAGSFAGKAVMGTAGVAMNLTGLGTVGRKMGSMAAGAKNYIDNHGGLLFGGIAAISDGLSGKSKRGGAKDDNAKDGGSDGNKPLPQNLRKDGK